MISFEVTRVEADTIRSIVMRALDVAREGDGHIGTRQALELNMDLTACHANGCPLLLEKLLCAPGADFTHDVWGIYRHLDRETGQLRHGFRPRTADPTHAEVGR